MQNANQVLMMNAFVMAADVPSEINHHQRCLKASVLPAEALGSKNARCALKAQQGQMAFSCPLILLFINTELGHLQNGDQLATFSVPPFLPYPPPSCQQMFPSDFSQRRLLNNTLQQSALTKDRREIYCPHLKLFSICIPQPILLAPPLITCLNRIPVRVAGCLH